MHTFWNFTKSKPKIGTVIKRISFRLFGKKKFPEWVEVKALMFCEKWNVYFIYCPSGVLLDYQRYTIRELKKLKGKLLIVCASPNIKQMPEELYKSSDSLYWKDLVGFDFSAYSLALHEIQKKSNGAGVIMMNDSVLGPFKNLDSIYEKSKFFVTGFTAWAGIENHIQSYAFSIKSVDENFIKNSKKIFSMRMCYNRHEHVVYLQETKLANVLSKNYKVGSTFYDEKNSGKDPTLSVGYELFLKGFPFIKKSIVSVKYGEVKFAENLLQIVKKNCGQHAIDEIIKSK